VTPLLATSLVLLSALLHAAWNAILKREKDASAGAATIVAVALVCAAAWALLARGPAFPNGAAVLWTLAAGAAEAVYFLALARSLVLLPLGPAYTISRGGSLLLVWPISVALLGERARPVAAIGAALVFLGIVATGVPKKGEARAVHARGIAWACACAAFIAVVFLAYKRAIEAGAERTALFATSLALSFPLNVAWVGKGALGRMKRVLVGRPAAIVFAGVVCTASFLLFLGALETDGAGRVLTLRNTSVVFAYAFAWAAGERPTALQLAGGALVALGAALLGMA
jgi:drug/metabolite transporter (DMT)-like permease